MRSFDNNYNKTLSGRLESNPPAEEWGDIISETAMYPFLKNDTLLNKAFSDNYKDNKLLVSLLRALYNPLSEEVSLKLFSDFGGWPKGASIGSETIENRLSVARNGYSPSFSPH